MMTDSAATYSLRSNSRAQTMQYGAALGTLLLPGDMICLTGDLGAGKTAFAGGIAQGWGAREPASSPTFVLVHEHRRTTDGVRLVHLDCYRLNGIEDAESIGIEDILSGSAVIVIEWPERIIGLLPADRVWVELTSDEENVDVRTLIFSVTGKRSTYLLSAFTAALQVIR